MTSFLILQSIVQRPFEVRQLFGVLSDQATLIRFGIMSNIINFATVLPLHVIESDVLVSKRSVSSPLQRTSGNIDGEAVPFASSNASDDVASRAFVVSRSIWSAALLDVS